MDADTFIGDLKGFVRGVANGETVAAALSVGLFALATILILQRWLPKVPAVLVAVVLSILAASIFELSTQDVSLVGVLPQGFPPFTIPRVGLGDIPMLFGGAVAIAVVSLADTISTASSFVPGVPGYHDLQSYPDAKRLPGCVIFRFDAPLFFANTRTFRQQMRLLAAGDPRPLWIVVASEPMTDIDTTAADMLEDLAHDLHSRGIALVFAEMKDPVRHKIDLYRMPQTINPDRCFPTITDAVHAFRDATGAEWESTAAPTAPARDAG